MDTAFFTSISWFVIEFWLQRLFPRCLNVLTHDRLVPHNFMSIFVSNVLYKRISNKMNQINNFENKLKAFYGDFEIVPDLVKRGLFWNTKNNLITFFC